MKFLPEGQSLEISQSNIKLLIISEDGLSLMLMNRNLYKILSFTLDCTRLECKQGWLKLFIKKMMGEKVAPIICDKGLVYDSLTKLLCNTPAPIETKTIILINLQSKGGRNALVMDMEVINAPNAIESNDILILQTTC